MPWQETDAVDQRQHFIEDWQTGEYTKTALCAAYGVSRPTGDKWLARYEASGRSGLVNRSRAPHHHPAAVSEAQREMIIATKLNHQAFGPKKVLDWLRRTYPDQAWPADSTAGELLRRAGLVCRRRRRRCVAPFSGPLAHCQHNNAVWSADFKGDFALGNQRRCYPLTISDNYSRYLLACQALSSTDTRSVQPWFEWVFREYGLPAAIRTDNGVPFASLAVGGLSSLAVWWIKLGIVPERIAPGKPSQNGRHERMHRSLESGVHPIAATAIAQQRQFDLWRHEYNHDRSHEALNRRTPSQVYRPSPRSYPAKLPTITYPDHMVVRQVRHNGEIKWRGQRLYLTETLTHEPVGLCPIADGRWEIFYSFLRLAYLDERTMTIERPVQRHRSKQ